MSAQYIRRFVMQVIGAEGDTQSFDEQLSIEFCIHHGTSTYPHTANVRVYNLSDKTIQNFAKEFTRVQIQAGYEGNYGVIFQGTVKQVRQGRESGTDAFCDIFAADGDILHNQGVINKTLYSGYTQQHVWTAIKQTAAPYTPTNDLSYIPASNNPSPRGKVMYGMVRESIRDFSRTNQQLVTVDNGHLTALPLYAYKQSEAVVINTRTGLIGTPMQTEAGIAFMCLLNPALAWSVPVKLNNTEITRNLVTDMNQQIVVGGGTPNYQPNLASDGFYKALTVDHIGSTRGHAWFTQVICIALDPTKAQPLPVPLHQLDVPLA